MTKAFVDATVICDWIGLPFALDDSRKQIAEDGLRRYESTQSCFYALKELRSGPLSALILLHNYIAESSTLLSGVSTFLRATCYTPRKAIGGTTAIINGLLNLAGGEYTEKDIKSQVELWLTRTISEAWQRRHSAVSEFSFPLYCFIDGDLELDGRRLVLENKGDPGCAKSARCGAALDLKARSAEVRKLVEALKPPKKGVIEKRELTSRRKALKEILEKSPQEFNKSRCRAIGDAYYCIMAADGADILTTNVVDFEPLANALGKVVAKP